MPQLFPDFMRGDGKNTTPLLSFPDGTPGETARNGNSEKTPEKSGVKLHPRDTGLTPP